MINFAGIRIPFSTIENIRRRGPISREEYRLLQGVLPVRLGSPQYIMGLVAGRAYRIPGKAEVYIYAKGKLRHVPDWQTLEAMGNPPVYNIDQATFDATPKGPPLPSVLEKEEPPPPPTPIYEPPPPPTPIYEPPPPEEITMLVAGRFYRIPGKTEVYKYEAPTYERMGHLRHVPDWQTLQDLGNPPVYNISQATFDATPKGPPLPSVLEKPAPLARKQVICPQCKSTLETIPPSPEKMVTQAFTWLTCPVCGYPKLYYVPTGGYTVSVKVRKPWPPVTYALPPPEEEPLVTPPDKYPPTWPISYLPPEVIEITKGAPPTDYKDTIGLPEGIPVEEALAYWVEEPKLAVAEAPAVSWTRKNWLPLTIIGGLGTAAMGVYLKKRKKRS